MKFRELAKAEREKAIGFFGSKYSVPEGFWDSVSLLKRVNSVWLCSKKAAEIANGFSAQSCGIMILLEFKTMKESRQAADFFSNYLF